jgi:hypothetical protein
MTLSKIVRILESERPDREYTIMAGASGQAVVILHGQEEEEDREFYTVTESKTGPVLIPA